MDNWIFLFLGLILAYLLEFTRPFVKSLYDKGIFASKETRLKMLVDDYYIKRYYKANLTEFILKLIKDIAIGLGLISLILVLFALFSSSNNTDEVKSTLLSFIAAFAGATFVIFNRVVREYFDVILFEDYENKLMKKIRKLGIPNPEEIIKQADEQSGFKP